MKNDELVVDFTYEVDRIIGDNSPFEYIDNKDNDWGVFIENRINNLTKKNNFIQILME